MKYPDLQTHLYLTEQLLLTGVYSISKLQNYSNQQETTLENNVFIKQ